MRPFVSPAFSNAPIEIADAFNEISRASHEPTPSELNLTQAAGSGTILRSITDKLEEFASVADFGAAPTKTAAENTASFNNAIARAGATGIVVVPAGTYLVTFSAMSAWAVPLFGMNATLSDVVGPVTIRLGAPGQVWMAAAPTVQTWRRGDIVWNIAPSAAGVPGWMCVTAGAPGTWKAMAALAA